MDDNMNIFYIHEEPKMCAEWAVDSHCVKMILESAQLLSTAHRVIDGSEYIDDGGKRKVKRWRLDDDRNITLYSATHVNHPSAVWARESNNNYNWLWCYLYEHCKEYTYRYNKIHKCESYIKELGKNIPLIPDIGFTSPAQAMPDMYKSDDAIESYRAYYFFEKTDLHSWKKRNIPDWITETKNLFVCDKIKT